MKTEIVINSGHVQLMVQFMRSRHIALSSVFDEHQLARIANISTGRETTIPCSEFADMLRQLVSYLGEPDVILQIAAMVETSHLGIVGCLLHACENLGEALLCLQRYRRLLVSVVEEQVLMGADRVELQWHYEYDQDHIVLELGIAIMMQFARQLVDQPFPILIIAMMQPQPVHAHLYHEFFACQVAFSQPVDRIVFPLANLLIPVRQPDRQMLDILQQQADQVLQALPENDAFLQQVKQHLVCLCQSGRPNVQGLAQSMHVSVRTIQRRLAEHQFTFQQMLDMVRHRLCMQYLEQKIQLCDIAQLLGYSDQSAFTRAYKRWTGNTPHQERQVAQHGNGAW